MLKRKYLMESRELNLSGILYYETFMDFYKVIIYFF